MNTNELSVIVFWSVAGYGLPRRRLASDFVKRLANPVIKTNNFNLSSFWTRTFHDLYYLIIMFSSIVQ